MFQLTTVVLILVCVMHMQLDAVGLRNFVYQKDVSEYCRRRALPSVFLSPGVMEANAQMFHFSRLDLPYSCYTSIRTESSKNIIMVIQLSSGQELRNSCRECGNQLLVYEFAETFGGYWGPIPNAILNPQTKKRIRKPYTLRTTRRSTPPTTSEPVTTTTEKTTTTWRPTENHDFITIEVPLVNISGSVIPGNVEDDKSFDDDEAFDVLYDVTPRQGEKYDTSIIPLVQFSVKREPIKSGLRDDDGEPRYELEYDLGPFTPDPSSHDKNTDVRFVLNNNKINTCDCRHLMEPQRHLRLTLPMLTTRSNINRNKKLWKPKYLMKQGHKSKSITALFTRESYTFGTPEHKRILEQGATKAYTKVTKQISTEDSFYLINDIMRSLNKSRKLEWQEHVSTQNYVSVIKNISEMRHNFSAYLAPWPMYAYLPVSKVIVNFTKKFNIDPLKGTTGLVPITSTQEMSRKSEKMSRKLLDTEEQISEYDLAQPGVKFASVLSNAKTKTSTIQFKSTTLATKVSQTTSMESVSHDLMNNTGVHTIEKPEGFNTSKSLVPNTTPYAVPRSPFTTVVGRLGKRHIVAIPIKVARPHGTPRTSLRVSTERVLRYTDVQQFAQLIEVPDDELSQHIALRLMRQFTGNALFNICQSQDVDDHNLKTRHVVLFNSSRIILAIGNFTISRMTVVMTTARTLQETVELCPDKNIECQVGGARVCIDSCSACDGVPNCGAHDIYDEDRLQCGGATGLQHNVCLAAITFLAVLLTLLYIVHYWLKRCVPKVADAFFVYSDGADNVLFLDSIMRSPTDVDLASKYMFDSILFEETKVCEELAKERKNMFNRVLSSISYVFKRRPSSCELTEAGDLQTPEMRTRQVYSFTELELRNMAATTQTDAAVQTGESLEMAFLRMINSHKKDEPVTTNRASNQLNRNDSLGTPQPLRTPKKDKDHGFSSAHFNLDEPGPSSRSAGKSHKHGARIAVEEKELHNTVFEHQAKDIIFDETSKHEDPLSAAIAKKHLRFQEKALLIPSAEEQNSLREQTLTRQSVLLGSDSNKQSRKIINASEILPHDSERGLKDFRRFFTSKKGKKK